MATFDEWSSIVRATAANCTKLALVLDQQDFVLVHFYFFHPVKKKKRTYLYSLPFSDKHTYVVYTHTHTHTHTHTDN